MITLHIPLKSARNLLEYINDFLDNTNNRKIMKEAIGEKMRIKKAIGRSEGIPKCMLTDFKLKDIVR